MGARMLLGLAAVAGMAASAWGAAGGRAEALPPAKHASRPFDDKDAELFREPPRVFHPETWFHFIGGNVSLAGITADLEAIRGAGISGIQLFHGQFGGPWPGMEEQIQCLSGPWDGMVRHVADECARLGLRFTMQNCPGWAMSGGPWIAPSNAMRHLVWSRTDVAGGGAAGVLPVPQPSKEAWRDYREVAVVAFPVPEGDTGQPLAPVSVKSNREGLPWEKCLRNAKGGQIVLEPEQGPVWVEATFAEAVTLRTVRFPSVRSFNHGWCYDPGVTVTVEAVLPGGPREVARVAMPPSNWQDHYPISLACSEAAAATCRITIRHAHRMTLGSIQLFTGARQHDWEGGAGWVLRGLDRSPQAVQKKAAWLDPAGIVDLTDRMDAQGKLAWTAPAGGAWTVLRIGHVNTGRKNAPAPAEATGWECDKLSPAGAEAHFAGYIGRLSGKAGPLGNGALQGLLLDSWECETQTWTPGLDRQFTRLRGYPLAPWFPALFGYVVGDPETTARFLRDWRATVNDLLVKNFFGRMAALGHKNGLAVSFETASGDVFPADILEYYKHADVPMCEFWHPRSESSVGSFEFKPVKPCVSAARLYGKPRVAAEAFTSFALTWTEHPGMLKDIANMHFAEGVTHLVFHTFTHNPRTDFLPPSTSLGSNIGTPFLRRQTWWAHMPEFTEYLARCGYLLERGRPVSDVLWYLGDEGDHKPRQDAPFPKGFKYDYCNPDLLLNRLAVRNGLLVTPEGLSYRALWLRECPRMLPETLEKLVTLVRKGATLVGERPRGLATLSGGAEAERRFAEAVAALWGGPGGAGERRVGKGRVLAGIPLEAALGQLGLTPDVEGEGVLWTHRQTRAADWYFVAAPAEKGFRGTVGFRCLGRAELWDPLTGEVRSAGAVRRQGDRSLVEIELPPSGALFVVFRAKGKEPGLGLAERAAAWRQVPVAGPWSLAFPAGWGAPEAVEMAALKSWTELDLPAEARAFSGTATYSTAFALEPLPEGAAVQLDLGRVEAIARVSVNGEPVGTVWAPPYRLDVTRAVKPGVNRLSVDVTSTWHNRLAYDAGRPEGERKTWTLAGPDKGAAWLPSGLLGPVVLRMAERVPEGPENP